MHKEHIYHRFITSGNTIGLELPLGETIFLEEPVLYNLYFKSIDAQYYVIVVRNVFLCQRNSCWLHVQ